jgi:hypothetical protein
MPWRTPKRYSRGEAVEGNGGAIVVERGHSAADVVGWTSGFNWGMWTSGSECWAIGHCGSPMGASAGSRSRRLDGRTPYRKHFRK